MGCGNSKSTRVENAPFPVIKQTKPVAAEQEREGKISEQPESGTESSGKDKQTTDSKPEQHGPLTPKQILIVQNTWGIVKGSSDLQQIGIEFYVRYFHTKICYSESVQLLIFLNERKEWNRFYWDQCQCSP